VGGDGKGGVGKVSSEVSTCMPQSNKQSETQVVKVGTSVPKALSTVGLRNLSNLNKLNSRTYSKQLSIKPESASTKYLYY
jgi:hypothetical protein